MVYYKGKNGCKRTCSKVWCIPKAINTPPYIKVAGCTAPVFNRAGYPTEYIYPSLSQKVRAEPKRGYISTLDLYILI